MLITDRIIVQGLTCFAHHGVSDAEQAVGGRYRVDLVLERDLAGAGASDRLADTTSYGEVARLAAGVVTGRRFRLLEALAEALAAEILARFAVDAVTVRVTKEQPPLPELALGSAAVEIRRLPPSGAGGPTREGNG